MYVRSYKELFVWQKSVLLVKEVYTLTNAFPQSEIYGLTSQLRRSATSVPSNIAEGYGRYSRKEFHHHCAIAYGSALELETQIIIAKEIGIAKSKDYSKIEELLEEVIKMLRVMLLKINN